MFRIGNCEADGIVPDQIQQHKSFVELEVPTLPFVCSGVPHYQFLHAQQLFLLRTVAFKYDIYISCMTTFVFTSVE